MRYSTYGCMFVGSLLYSAQAHASYLYGLSQGDMNDIGEYYDLDPSAQDVMEAMLTSPFNCGHFGDLCDMVGPTRANPAIALVYELALAETAISSLVATVDADVDEKEDDWLEEIYPEGIPEDDPFWDFGSSSAQTCNAWDDDDTGVSKKETTEWTSSSIVWRLQARAWKVATGLYTQEGGTSRTFYDHNSDGNFDAVSTSQTIDVYLSPYDYTCDSVCDTETATAKKARKSTWYALGFAYFPYINVTASTSAYSVSADTSVAGGMNCY